MTGWIVKPEFLSSSYVWPTSFAQEKSALLRRIILYITSFLFNSIDADSCHDHQVRQQQQDQNEHNNNNEILHAARLLYEFLRLSRHSF